MRTNLLAVLILVAAPAFSADYVALYKRVAPAVVSIHVLEADGEGRATGMLVDSIHVVTCAHVIKGAMRIEVLSYPFGIIRDAKVIGVDKVHDLALLVLDDHIIDTSSVHFRDSDTVEVGEPVLIIGNTLGEFDWSATAGIVSGLHRLNFNWTQTDATINPGNSGSPVFDSHGRVIGIAEARIGPTKGVPGTQFYIPSGIITSFLTRYTLAGK